MVTVEYVVVLVLVSMGCSLAIAGLGAPLLRMYVGHHAWLMLPFP